MRLTIRNVSKHFDLYQPFFAGPARRRARFAAVKDVSLEVAAGQCVGLVGESGCGKSTLARIAAGISDADAGHVRLEGEGASSAAKALGLPVQMIFQNPMASLNPRQRVGDAVTEAAIFHKFVSRRDSDELAVRLFEQVGLDPATRTRFPHEFSGGQRQRIGLARALAVNPSILVLDEAVSALDVSTQLKIIDLLDRLRADLGLGMLFISHDLQVVRSICDTVHVMYLGGVVEAGETREIFGNPQHPYTQLLLRSVLRMEGPPREFEEIASELPSPLSPPSGCAFHPRCASALQNCAATPPEPRIVAARTVACHLAGA